MKSRCSVLYNFVLIKESQYCLHNINVFQFKKGLGNSEEVSSKNKGHCMLRRKAVF